MRHQMIVRPHRNVYVRAEYWQSLDPPERARHVIKTLSRQFPNRIFAGISAAAVMRLEYPWSLHDQGPVFLATTSSSQIRRAYWRIKRIHMADIPVQAMRYFEDGSSLLGGIEDDRDDCVDSVRITSPERTLVDCGLLYSFEQALPMFDSALRCGLVTRESVLEICDSLYVDCDPILRLLHYADPLSENGGESRCRAVIIEAGFVPPVLQCVFEDPTNDINRYRADFSWRLADGAVVVLEYDGMRKYTDQSMTQGRDIREIVRMERLRENALRMHGVTMVIRTDYDEVSRRAPLIRKLAEAGIPARDMRSLVD